MPTMRSGCIALRAISAIGSAEVFVAMTASSRTASSSSLITLRFTAMSSKTASMTRSARRKPE